MYREDTKNRFSRTFIWKQEFFLAQYEERESLHIFLSHSRTMKRSMSQQTMCLQCFEPVQSGWQMLHHKRSCKGKRAVNEVAQTKARPSSFPFALPCRAFLSLPCLALPCLALLDLTSLDMPCVALASPAYSCLA